MKRRNFSSSILFGNLLGKIFILFVLFSIARVLFFFCNYNSLKSVSVYDLIRAFFVGIRVDMVAIFTLNLPIFLFWLFPARLKARKVFSKSANILFFIVNFLALLVNVIDARYFSFSCQRMNGDIFKEGVLLTENFEVYLEMIKQFWYVPLTGILILMALWGISFRLPVVQKVNRIKFREYIGFIIGVAVCILCMRGGFQRKSLKSNDVLACTEKPSTAPLASNSALNIVHTYGREILTELNFYRPGDRALALYSLQHDPKYFTENGFHGKNIFIIILESFSGEYVGGIDQQFKKEGTRSFTPFLDSLMEKSYVFDAFANGRVSVAGLAAVAGGVPALFDASSVADRYTENIIVGFPELLEKMGYHTVFFYGGHRNSCHFDSVRVKAGIKSYYCCDDYDGPKKDIRAWGVYDDRFLQFVARKVKAMQKPFVSVVFTLSSHHPYYYPEEFNGRFPKDDIPLPEFIAYADYSLQKFFETAEKMDWYKDTIFILVADHTAGQRQPYYINDVGGLSIPLIIFDPNGGLVGRSDTVVQQIDIMPTILNLLGYDLPYFAFGSDMFDKDAPHFAVSFSNGIYQIITHDFVLQMDAKQPVGFYLREDYLLKNNLVQSPEYQEDIKKVETFFKVFLQKYSTVMLKKQLEY